MTEPLIFKLFYNISIYRVKIMNLHEIIVLMVAKNTAT